MVKLQVRVRLNKNGAHSGGAVSISFFLIVGAIF